MEPWANHFSSLNPDFFNCNNEIAVAVSQDLCEDARVRVTAYVIINIADDLILSPVCPFGYMSGQI